VTVTWPPAIWRSSPGNAEEIPRLQRLDRRVVGGGREMGIAGIVAVLHAAIADPALQFGVVVQRRDEAVDLAMPLLAVPLVSWYLIMECFIGRSLARCPWLLVRDYLADRLKAASMDKNDSMDFSAT